MSKNVMEKSITKEKGITKKKGNKKHSKYRKELENKMREIIEHDREVGRLGMIDKPLTFMVEETLEYKSIYRAMEEDEFIELLFTPILEVAKKFPNKTSKDPLSLRNNAEMYRLRENMVRTYEEKARQELEYEASLKANRIAIIGLQ